jgi:xylulose-5-phosphate/fructose-6-phosphate phosphoketolase
VDGHVDVNRFHVRGFKEQGTTPFDMVVLNGMSRYHLATEALRRSARQREDRTPTLISECESLIARAMAYSQEHLEDMPEIRNWTWSEE